MSCVALRKESVDRNSRPLRATEHKNASLSARRAWIEIKYGIVVHLLVLVALRKESVDRNRPASHLSTCNTVALRKESVDRNFCVVSLNYKEVRRSPQGERG